jgi:hypothetical protein
MDVDPLASEEDADTGLRTSVLFVVRSLAHNDADPTLVEGFVHPVVDTRNDCDEVSNFEVVLTLWHPSSMLAI